MQHLSLTLYVLKSNLYIVCITVVCGFYTRNIKLQSRLDVDFYFTGYLDKVSGKRVSTCI